VPDACASAEAYLPAHVVGQDLALTQLADAVCHHLGSKRPGKPLIISAHGPPGVGKTLTHQLLARALYSRAPGPGLRCPGRDCRGYKVRAMGAAASRADPLRTPATAAPTHNQPKTSLEPRNLQKR
jgi:Cdc6-like AAA superfamily ATPase